MQVLVFPPNESLSILVNFDSLKTFKDKKHEMSKKYTWCPKPPTSVEMSQRRNSFPLKPSYFYDSTRAVFKGLFLNESITLTLGLK